MDCKTHRSLCVNSNTSVLSLVALSRNESNRKPPLPLSPFNDEFSFNFPAPRSLQLPGNDNDNFRDSNDIMYANNSADSQTCSSENNQCSVFYPLCCDVSCPARRCCISLLLH